MHKENYNSVPESMTGRAKMCSFYGLNQSPEAKALMSGIHAGQRISFY